MSVFHLNELCLERIAFFEQCRQSSLDDFPMLFLPPFCSQKFLLLPSVHFFPIPFLHTIILGTPGLLTEEGRD